MKKKTPTKASGSTKKVKKKGEIKSIELSDEQLDAISGGTGILISATPISNTLKATPISNTLMATPISNTLMATPISNTLKK